MVEEVATVQVGEGAEAVVVKAASVAEEAALVDAVDPLVTMRAEAALVEGAGDPGR